MGVGTGTGVRSPPHDRAVRSVNAVSTRQTQEREKWGNRAMGVFRLITLTPTLSLRERGPVGWYSCLSVHSYLP